MTLHQVLQSLVFASPKPISSSELVAILKGAGESSEHADAQAYSGLSKDAVEQALGETRDEMDASGAPFRMVEGANGWSFVTHGDYAPWVRQLYPEAKPTRLSGPALETLAIIAYRQPLTRADIEAVRGVAVDGVMQVLLDRGLVKIAGRAELPGRPLLYSTTNYFLEHFGLKSTEELPNSEELRRLDLPKAPEVEEKPARKRGRKMEGLEEGASVLGTAPQPADGAVQMELAAASPLVVETVAEVAAASESSEPSGEDGAAERLVSEEPSAEQRIEVEQPNVQEEESADFGGDLGGGPETDFPEPDRN